MHYLRRAVDHEGEVLEVLATKDRDKAAALKLIKRLMKRYGKPQTIVTDGLRVDPILRINVADRIGVTPAGSVTVAGDELVDGELVL
jgi:transposase-like protein